MLITHSKSLERMRKRFSKVLSWQIILLSQNMHRNFIRDSQSPAHSMLLYEMNIQYDYLTTNNVRTESVFCNYKWLPMVFKCQVAKRRFCMLLVTEFNCDVVNNRGQDLTPGINICTLYIDRNRHDVQIKIHTVVLFVFNNETQQIGYQNIL